MTDKEFEQLLNEYCDETISKEQSEILEEELLRDPQRREIFSSFMNLDASLKEHAENDPEPTAAQSQSQKLPMMAILICILLVINIWVIINQKSQQATISLNTLKPEPLQTGVGIITKSLDLKNPSSNLSPGRILEAGNLNFTDGTLHIEMFSGVNLLLSGPTDINLTDSMNVLLKEGYCRFMVPPPAKGFSFSGPLTSLKTDGGEFSLSSQKNQSYINIHEGTIQIISDDPKNPPKTIHSKKSYNLKTKEILPLNNSTSFLSFEKALALNKILGKKKFNNWQKFSKETAQRKDVLLYYTFQNEVPYSRIIHNSSSTKGLNGSIVGSQWTQGRWPDKKALNFSSTGDRIRLNIPGSHKAMTFSCWVKIRSFDRWLSSLLLTEDYNRGELHWQLSDSGEIILGDANNGNTFSPPVINEQDLGRWLHLATVYDPNELKVKHYLDGQKVYEQNFRKAHKIKMGMSDIGNWTSKARQHHIRSFNGVIDEFILFTTPLSDDGIKKIYDNGKPN